MKSKILWDKENILPTDSEQFDGGKECLPKTIRYFFRFNEEISMKYELSCAESIQMLLQRNPMNIENVIFWQPNANISLFKAQILEKSLNVDLI